jgi:cellulose synthase/poly-beta-1,6-N-acetylglucosamine synthase-like glycosyltransferase
LNPVLEAWFWILLAAGLYPYAIYPLLVWLLGRVTNRSVRRDDAYLPRVTVITAAFNEQAHIEATVRDKLAQDYPRELLEMIVVSDCSSDATDDIVRKVAAEDPRVQLLRNETRAGKTTGLNLALPRARGDIVVFSDANSIYRPDAIRKLVRNFADERVGYVTGRMLYVNPDGSLVGDGCSAYMRYENALRAAENRLGSIVGVDGGVDAIRRSLYQPMRADQLPDFVSPLNVSEQGYRVIYEADAVLTEDALSAQAQEYRMRVRVALRAFWALWDKRALLNPFRFGLFSWQLWSHKLLRYLAFAPLAAAVILNWLLLGHGAIYAAGVAAQVVFGVACLLAAAGSRAGASLAPVRYCFYFFLLNWASAVAFVRFIRGQKQVLWQPRVG